MPRRRTQFSRLAYWVGIAALFGYAAWQRFSLPLDPIADPDTWGYLAPAIHKLTDGAFVHHGRNFVYPGFLLLLLRGFGDFRAIVVVQHLLGLSAGGLLLLTWRRLRCLVPASRLSPPVHQGLGLIMAAIFLVAGDPIRVEMQLRPEAVCAFLLSLNLYCAIEFIAGTFIRSRCPAVWFGIWAGFTAVLLCSIKPSFVLLALVPLLPVGIFFFRRNWFRQKIALGSGVLVCAILVLLPGYFLSHDDPLARMFLPTTLFAIHADLIRDQMAEDVERGEKLPYPREWLGRMHDELDREIAKSALDRRLYPSLGFSPDYLMYDDSSIAAKLDVEFNDDIAAASAFDRFYYWRVWRHRPLQMVNKVVRQLAIFYAPLCPAYDRSKILPLRIWYQIGVSSLNEFTYPEVGKAYPPAMEFMRRIEALAQNAPAIEQKRVERKALTLLAAAYRSLLASTLAFGAATLFSRDYRRRLGWLVVLALFVFSYNAAACLEVAIIHSLEVPRYSTVQMLVTLVAEFLAAWLLCEWLMGMRHRAETYSA